VQGDRQYVPLQVVEDHVAEVDELQHVAYRQDRRFESLLERDTESLIVLQVELQAAQGTIEILPSELPRPIRSVGFCLNDECVCGVLNRHFRRKDIASRDLTSSEAEDTQQLLSKVW
jgi:hypothetical protein